MRTLAIGDIHGAAVALEVLLAAVGPRESDQFVFLGDSVDRGPDTRDVIDQLIAFRARFPHTVFLRGNHELMMDRARNDTSARHDWLSVGGDTTLSSYALDGRPASWAAVPESHWDFLAALQDWHETDTHIFVHANAFPDLPMEEQPELMLFWEFLTGPISHASGKTVVCGHTSQRSGLPLDYGNTVCLDTRAYNRGWLTCLDVHSRKYWQANQAGDVRSDWLEPPDDDSSVDED
ncbi:MAG: metallophosphoesterase family protein [Fimbriiglobus sp.]